MVGWSVSVWKAPARMVPGCHGICCEAGLVVLEVTRPNRQERHRNGKDDDLDAIEAARAVLAGRALATAKTSTGNTEALRVLVGAQRSAKQARIATMVQLRHLMFTAPDELRERYAKLSRRSSSPCNVHVCGRASMVTPCATRPRPQR